MKIRDRVYFEVTAFHLALLRQLRFQEGEGAPEVKAKRPFGDSDVIGDLQKIYSEAMGYEVLRLRDEGTIVIQGDRVISRGDGSGPVSDDIETMLWKTHREMSTVLQIVAQNLSIQEGVYSSERYRDQWTLSED